MQPLRSERCCNLSEHTLDSADTQTFPRSWRRPLRRATSTPPRSCPSQSGSESRPRGMGRPKSPSLQ
eukprot:jgi/Mesen1/3090/ME000184S02154